MTAQRGRKRMRRLTMPVTTWMPANMVGPWVVRQNFRDGAVLSVRLEDAAEPDRWTWVDFTEERARQIIAALSMLLEEGR